jgi:predicted RNA-binding protein with PIN domain
MELLVDTWNVLHQTGILPPESAGIGVQGLVKLINQSRWGGERVTLVCDGTPSENAVNTQKIQTIFTGPNRTADDEIMQLVSNSSSARNILVVTSDREIIRSIKTRGSRQIGSAAFLQTLVDDCATPSKKKVHRPSELSKANAEEWRKEFGIDEQVAQKKENDTVKDSSIPDELLEEARRLLGD